MHPIIWTMICTLFTGQTSKEGTYHKQIMEVHFTFKKSASFSRNFQKLNHIYIKLHYNFKILHTIQSLVPLGILSFSVTLVNFYSYDYSFRFM